MSSEKVAETSNTINKDHALAAWILYASDVGAEISTISEEDAWLKAEKRVGFPRGLLRQGGWKCVPVWIAFRDERLGNDNNKTKELES